MSKLARTLILAATVAALNLAGMTAVAHAPTTRTPLASRSWPRSGVTTTSRPESRRRNSKPQMQADATQRELSERWTYYYHATRMAPAELRAWMQPQDRFDTPTEPPAQVPAPVRPAEPSGQPGWLVVSLGAPRRWRPPGWPAVAARRAIRRARVGQAA